ncbi:MAG: hypothetical protein ABF856_15955, partial [Acetobacter aceti]
KITILNALLRDGGIEEPLIDASGSRFQAFGDLIDDSWGLSICVLSRTGDYHSLDYYALAFIFSRKRKWRIL